MLFMSYKLQDLGIPFTRVSAVCGKDHQSEYDTYMSQFSSNEIQNKLCVNTVGAWGLLLTYKQFITPLHRQHKHVMVLEDDVCFHRNYNTLLQTYADTINEHDVVWLGCQFLHWTSKIDHSVKTNGMFCPDVRRAPYGTPLGAYGVVYSSRFLQALEAELDACMGTKRIHNIDVFTSLVLKKHPTLKACCLKPCLVMPQVFESDNMGHRDIHSMCRDRRWDLSVYTHVELTAHFADVYCEVVHRGAHLSEVSHEEPLFVDMSHAELQTVFDSRNKLGETHFVFIITSHNNEQWVQRNLASVVNQKYTHWRIIYVDDCSADGTAAAVQAFADAHNIHHRLTLVQNDTQMHQAYGRWVAAKQCADHEMCCLLDGDDWLVDRPDVLSRLDSLFRKHDLLISYGQFFSYTGDEKNMKLCSKSKYTPKDIQDNRYRHKWVTPHLRVVSASLLKTIPEDYLKIDGKWLSCCTDMAEMYWCLERSEGRHMNVGFPTVVYNKCASLTYTNSYYTQASHPEECAYRQKVLAYLQAYPAPQPDTSCEDSVGCAEA